MTDFTEQGLDIFVEECIELLQDMESGLNQLSDDLTDEELINSVFRAAHTIKGSAGLFGLDDIIDFTHKVENVLSSIRSGNTALSVEIIEQLMRCKDHIEILVEALGDDISEENRQLSQTLVAQLEQVAYGQSDSKTIATAENTPTVEREEHSTELVATNYWHISLRFDQDVLRNGMDPLSILQYLANLGTLMHITTILDNFPNADDMDAESCYLGLEISFDSDADRQTIVDVFQFISDDSHVWVLPPKSKVSEYGKLLEKLQEADEVGKIGQLLIDTKILSERELKQALNIQEQSNDTQQPLGEILVEQQAVHPETVNQALKKQQQVRDNKRRESKFIRVDADALDQLVNMVGELVIATEGTNLRAKQLDDIALIESTLAVTRLVEDVRDRALNLRMVQIGDTFKRFNRVVRDVSTELNKDIKLTIDGGETELDKSVVEKIGDPLTHLIRNSIDHGIETAEERASVNKPTKGTVALNAFHDSGCIVIQVSDDGRGIDAEKLLAKAIANDVISPEQKLSRQEALQLIMHPGLSTKEQVSNLSGRGVGMDVVKRNVESLRGSIDISSELGKGTVISLRMPLTLSIISGLLVGVAECRYVLPLDSVIECIELPKDYQHSQYDGDYINLRGQALPFIDLGQQFNSEQCFGKRRNIVVVRHGDKKAGLLVDTLLGENQTVIKPLNKIFANLAGISGSTILADGDVALILDIPALVALVKSQI